MVRGVLEPVSLDCISDLDAGVNPLVGYVIEGIVVVPYLQWRTESERVDVVAESPLQTYYGLVALWVNKILTDFKIGGLCLKRGKRVSRSRKRSSSVSVSMTERLRSRFWKALRNTDRRLKVSIYVYSAQPTTSVRTALFSQRE